MTRSIPTVNLGDGLTVSKIGFGGMAVSHVYGDTDPGQALRTLNLALDEGVTFIDTADVYGQPREGIDGPAGTNEELISQLLVHRRTEVQLATKFGITGRIGVAGAAATRGDRSYVRSACEASLRRLGTDVIDLYYMHRRQLDIPIEDTVAAMAELVAEGKVRHLGLSEVTAAELRAAAAVHPIAAVQSEWSIWSRDVEAHVVPAAREVGAGFVPYSPLGRGFLTGALTPERIADGMLRNEPRFAQHYHANQQILALIADTGRDLGATPAQVALAWLYAQGQTLQLPVVPIPGTRSAQRVAENAQAVHLSLDPEHKARLDTAAALVHGDRALTFTSKDWISANRE